MPLGLGVARGQRRDTAGVLGGTGERGTEPLRCVPSIRSVMQKYLDDRGEVTFDKIFTQKIGELGTWGLRGTRGHCVPGQVWGGWIGDSGRDHSPHPWATREAGERCPGAA